MTAADHIVQHLLEGAEAERIISAASKIRGNIYTGTYHPDCMWVAHQEGAFPEFKTHEEFTRAWSNGKIEPEEEGFMTNQGRFVSREEAFKIATRAQQIEPESDDLLRGRYELDAGDAMFEALVENEGTESEEDDFKDVLDLSFDRYLTSRKYVKSTGGWVQRLMGGMRMEISDPGADGKRVVLLRGGNHVLWQKEMSDHEIVDMEKRVSSRLESIPDEEDDFDVKSVLWPDVESYLKEYRFRKSNGADYWVRGNSHFTLVIWEKAPGVWKISNSYVGKQNQNDEVEVNGRQVIKFLEDVFDRKKKLPEALGDEDDLAFV